MEILEKLRGSGRVLLGEEVVLARVSYHLLVWRDRRTSSPQFDGSLELSVEAASRLMESPLLLTLELRDRRQLLFRMTSATGRITNHRP